MNQLTTHRKDEGFTLVEVLIVIVILGILATVVVVSVRGVKDRGEDARCDSDVRILQVAVESYFAQVGGNQLPPTGATDDRFELTLMGAGLVRQPSEHFDLDQDGQVLMAVNSACVI